MPVYGVQGQPQAVLDGVPISEHAPRTASALSAPHLRQHSPGSIRAVTDRPFEASRSQEALLAANTALRTRVNELEVINDLFRGRVSQLEHELNLRREGPTQHGSDGQLRTSLDESRRRENDLKRRLDDLEQEVSGLRGSSPRAKKMRVSDIVEGGGGVQAVSMSPPATAPSTNT